MSGEKFNPLKIPTGSWIGPYEVVGLEAEGGYGYLYRVRRDGKDYALKIGRYSFAGQYPDDRERDEERLDREIAAMKTLRHPNIVRVLAFDRWPDLEGGYPYLVMEFVEGQRLDEWLVDSAPALARIVGIYERIALAVDHMHSHGIFHRDLKAQNVVVRGDGEPVVLDFGLARPRYAHEVTRAGTIGTVTHYAPEYVRWCDSAASLTEPFVWQVATDLHAFGYMLYEAFTGRSPFAAGTKSHPASDSELLLAIKKIVPKRPSTWNPRIPAVLDELVMQLLAKEPEQRPQSAGAVAEVLRQAREAARASGDKVWTEPFDLPPDGAPAAAGEVPHAEEAAAGAAAGAAPAQADARPLEAAAAPGLAELIREGGAAAERPASLPTRERGTEFVDEPGRDAPVASDQSPDPLAETMAAVKEQVARSRRRLGPLLIGGVVVAATLAAIMVVGWLQPPAKEGPRRLLSLAESSGTAAPASSVVPGLLTDAGLAASPAASSETAAPPGTAPAPPEPDALPEVEREGRSASRSAPASTVQKPASAAVPAPRPAAFEPELAPIAVSRPIAPEGGLLRRSQRVQGLPDQAPALPRPRGIPYGSHIRAKLLSNLDTRTIGSGPVEAILDAPHVVRGEIVLPVRTMAYGTASETAGRFTIRFSRLRLPDDTEVPFEAIAMARDDGKPGLAAGRRIERPPDQREGVATQIAKGTGNILLDTISGGTPATLAQSAGRTVLSQEAPSQPAASSQWALLLDAGVVFDLWVERAF